MMLDDMTTPDGEEVTNNDEAPAEEETATEETSTEETPSEDEAA